MHRSIVQSSSEAIAPGPRRLPAVTVVDTEVATHCAACPAPGTHGLDDAPALCRAVGTEQEDVPRVGNVAVRVRDLATLPGSGCRYVIFAELVHSLPPFQFFFRCSFPGAQQGFRVNSRELVQG